MSLRGPARPTAVTVIGCRAQSNLASLRPASASGPGLSEPLSDKPERRRLGLPVASTAEHGNCGSVELEVPPSHRPSLSESALSQPARAAGPVQVRLPVGVKGSSVQAPPGPARVSHGGRKLTSRSITRRHLLKSKSAVGFSVVSGRRRWPGPGSAPGIGRTTRNHSVVRAGHRSNRIVVTHLV